MGGAVTENSYSLRFNIESAGNVLYGLAKLTGMHQNTEGEYAILNIPFAQYLKADFDYAKNISLDAKNSLSYQVNLGFAYEPALLVLTSHFAYAVPVRTPAPVPVQVHPGHDIAEPVIAVGRSGHA